ncbi:class I SAM-dependent methyltransferase [Leucobacter salsicius]|uniref:class I SAM-dependent methyltransferase n=1 Tax=Leucobacter salsicius TaxID=664638 RepID=UPI0018DC848D|nr:class I SAM-dependent methyltransferase [Leucobacter salsicius]
MDVLFDDARVWSIDVRANWAGGTFDWPNALLPFLTGSTCVLVQDSATGVQIASLDVRFTEAPHRTSVVDDAGIALAVNKWGRMGIALEHMGADVQALIVQRAAEIVAFLDSLGLRPFVVGGTLLGACRSQSLLPHDDDADIAYLSNHTHPADVAIEAFQVGHALTQAGYAIKRHSAAHMQLLFQANEHTAHPVDYYIDVFTAFFTPDGHVNQPFHVRGIMREDQMLPFVPVRIGDTEFPGPSDTDRWLTINYDANWRTPIPGYQIKTPPATRERFDDWFGWFNLHREFWDEEFAAAVPIPTLTVGDADWAAGRDWLAQGDARSCTLIDLGCGTGELTRQLASQLPSRRVIGADFSDIALTRAALNSLPPDHAGTPEWAHVNLYRATTLGLAYDLGVTGPFDVVANHVFEQIGHRGREWGWRLLRMALRSGGTARLTFHEKPSASVRFEVPTGWHLTRTQVAEEAKSLGLCVTFEALGGARKVTGATITLNRSQQVLTPQGGI